MALSLLSPKQIITAAYLCEESYRAGKEIEDLSYLISRQDGVTYVAFRGTHNAENVKRDITVWPPKITPTYHLGHRGVISGYQLLKDSVLSNIGKADTVIVCGHSLGGGLALPFAELLDCPVVTWGAMRVYLRWMAPKLNHFRIARDDDPVPLLPGISCDHDCDLSLQLVDNDSEILNVKDHDMLAYAQWTERALRC